MRLRGDKGAYFFTADNADDVAGLTHTEDHHGHVVVFAEGDGRCIHDAEIEAKDVVVSDLLEFRGFVVGFGVCGVDSFDGGGFEKDICLDLHGAEAGGGVGGEEGVAGTGGEDDDATLF